MKVDLLYEIQAPKPWLKAHPYGQREAEQQSFYEALEQIKLADNVGFDTVWLVEHHFREGRSHNPSPEVVIGALSQTTERIGLGFGVVLMPHPFTHPVRVAEKIATADILSHGRVVWGTGRSTPQEQAVFGVPKDREISRRMWHDSVRTVVDMWGSEYYEEDSEFLKFPRRMVTPKPYQDPHPPCWLACGSDESYDVAGANGLGALGFHSGRSVEEMSKLVQRYRQASAKVVPLTGVVTNEISVLTIVHCAPTFTIAEDNGVWESIWWWYQNQAEFILEWEFPHFSDEQKNKMFPHLQARREGRFDPRQFNAEDQVIVGNPERCTEKFMRWRDVGGYDRVLCYMQFGQLSHEAIMKSIELVGTEVIPALKRQSGEVRVPTPAGVSS